MSIDTYRITTIMGKMNGKLPFLTNDEHRHFNSIGYSGKDLDGNKTTREKYLNSLKKGTFKVEQTQWNDGSFEERFIIIRVH